MLDLGGRFPMLVPLLRGASHVDVVTLAGDRPLREFIAAMMAYEPRWIRLLYRIRRVFVRLIGLRQEGTPVAPRWTPAQVPMSAGEAASFFRVCAAEEERYWAVDHRERHLKAALCVVREENHYSVVTIVHYLHWTGPVYFNVIRPFHHVVVRSMVRAGLHGPVLASVQAGA